MVALWLTLLGCTGEKVGPDDADGDGYTESTGDCDDAAADVHPGAAEACDDLDQDCNGVVDDGLSGVPETCNGQDDDCNGVVDDHATDAVTSYADGDGDGYGDTSGVYVGCDPVGVEAGGDCDDANPSIHPDAPETCADGLDSDCSGGDDNGGACRDSAVQWLDSSAASFIAATPGGEDYLVYGLGRGDVDLGGREDLIVGQVGRPDQIVAFVFPGERALPAEDVGAAIRVTYDDVGHDAGKAVAWLLGEGGQDTLVIGAPAYDSADGEGAVWVVDGPLTGDVALGVVAGIDHVTSASPFDETGAALAIADLDGDGVDEIWSGSPGFNPGGMVRRLDRHEGTWDWTPCVYVPSTGDERFGVSLAPAGDVDGDGLEDLLVGAPEARLSGGSGEIRGYAMVLAGNAGCDRALDPAGVSARLFGSTVGGRAGDVVVAAGDFDGDGVNEIGVSEPGSGDGSEARVWLVPASAALTSPGSFYLRDAATTALAGDVHGWHTGAGLAAGDLDGDGASDLAVSSPVPVTYGKGDSLTARVSVFYGPDAAAGPYVTADDVDYQAACSTSRSLGVPILAPLDRDGIPTLVISSECSLSSDMGLSRRGLYLVQPGPGGP